MKDTSPTLARTLAWILGALALVLFGLGIFVAVRARGTAGAAAAAAARDAEVLLIVPRMADVLQDAGRWFGQRVSATTPDEVAAVERELTMVRGRMWFETGRLRAAAPEFGGPAGEIEKAFQDLVVVGERARDAARARQPDRARAIFLGEFRPRFERLRAYFPTLAEGMGRLRAMEAGRRDEERRGAIRGALWGAGVAALVAFAAAFVAVRSLVHAPLAQIACCARSMVEGDLAVSIPGGNRTDEIGALASALSKLRHGQLRQKKMEEELQESSEKLKAAQASEDGRLIELQRAREELGRVREEMVRAQAATESARDAERALVADRQRIEADARRERDEAAAVRARDEAELNALRDEVERLRASATEAERLASEGRARREELERLRAELAGATEAAAEAKARYEELRQAATQRERTAGEAENQARDQARELDRVRQELDLVREEMVAVAAERALEARRAEEELKATREAASQRLEAEVAKIRREAAEEARQRIREMDELRDALRKAREDAAAIEQLYAEESRRLQTELSRLQESPRVGDAVADVTPPPAAEPAAPTPVSDGTPSVEPTPEPEPQPVPEEPRLEDSTPSGEASEIRSNAEVSPEVVAPSAETESGVAPPTEGSAAPTPPDPDPDPVPATASGAVAGGRADGAESGADPAPAGATVAEAETPAVPKPRAPRRKRAPKENPQLSLLGAEPERAADDAVRQMVDAGRLPGVDLEDAANRLGQSREVVEALLLESMPGQRRLLANLRRALEDEDLEEARRNAAALAGEAGHWGEHEVRRLAKTVELAIKFQQGNLEPMVADLEREAGRVFSGLEWKARRESPETGGDAGPTA